MSNRQLKGGRVPISYILYYTATKCSSFTQGKKVLKDIFGKIDKVMKHELQNRYMFSYQHFLNLKTMLWLCRKISLFVEKHIEIFRSDGALGLQLALKWFGKKILCTVLATCLCDCSKIKSNSWNICWNSLTQNHLFCIVASLKHFVYKSDI